MNEAKMCDDKRVLEVVLRPAFESVVDEDYAEGENDLAYQMEQGMGSELLIVKEGDDFSVPEGYEAILNEDPVLTECNEDGSNPDYADELSPGTYRFVGNGTIHRLK